MKRFVTLVLATIIFIHATDQSWAQTDLDAAIAAHPRFPKLAEGQKRGDLVSFQSGDRMLRGFLYTPLGDGPFPAIIWNHGSEKLPGWQPELAAFYNRHGFVFFIPHRNGHGRSPGDYIMDRLERLRDWALDVDLFRASVVEELEKDNQDVVAATEWLKKRPFVDPNRIVMSGVSFGGIQTLLAAEKGLGVAGFISFAPAAISWGNWHLRERLKYAVTNAKAPVFVLQAQNDYSTGPAETFEPLLQRKGSPNRAKIYPPFGKTKRHGHGAFATWNIGTEIWGNDVMSFIGQILNIKR